LSDESLLLPKMEKCYLIPAEHHADTTVFSFAGL